MKKALIADDSVTLIRLLTHFLDEYEGEEFEIFRAKDGADALFALRDNEIDIIFLDINMPVVDGYGVVNFIRDRELAVEIVIITSSLDKDTILALGKLSIKHFLPKPIRSDRLKTILDKIFVVKKGLVAELLDSKKG